MKKRELFILGLFLALSMPVMAQSYAFGLKGGIVGGMQRINGLSNRDILFGYQGDLFIESVDEENKFSLFAQAGYHQRGSAQIFNNGFNPFTRQRFPSARFESVFHNAALILGGKQKFEWNAARYYYAIGLRGEYTFDYDLGYLDHLANQDQLVRDVLYGVTFALGLEWPFGELVSGIAEIAIHPDLSRQMFLPEQTYNDRNGNFRTIESQSIHNISVELTIGLRFLHIVEIID